MIKPYYEEPGITIYHGDCREILPQLEPVDLVLTDPPYGVNGAKGSNAFKKKCTYETNFPDTPEYIRDIVVPIIIQCRSISKRMIITPGLRCNHFYPQPNDIGAFFHTGQAIKKCLEDTKLPTVDAKVRELLGAINYIAAGIIVLQEGSDGK